MRGTAKQVLPVHTGWVRDSDPGEEATVLAIDKLSYGLRAWEREDFRRHLRQRNIIGLVARKDEDEEVVGFVVFEFFKTYVLVHKLAVLPSYRHRGVGAQMVTSLFSRLSPHRRTRLVVEVLESNLNAQLFLRKQGFRATGILKEFYKDTGENAIRMIFWHFWCRESAGE